MWTHDGLPVLDPLGFALTHWTDQWKIGIPPLTIAWVTIAAPPCLRDVIIDDDSNTGVGEAFNHRMIDIKCSQADQICVGRQMRWVYQRILSYHLISIRQANAIEPEMQNGSKYVIPVLDIETPGNLENVTCTIPIKQKP